jgi:hypothetical protein
MKAIRNSRPVLSNVPSRLHYPFQDGGESGPPQYEIFVPCVGPSTPQLALLGVARHQRTWVLNSTDAFVSADTSRVSLLHPYVIQQSLQRGKHLEKVGTRGGGAGNLGGGGNTRLTGRSKMNEMFCVRCIAPLKSGTALPGRKGSTTEAENRGHLRSNCCTCWSSPLLQVSIGPLSWALIQGHSMAHQHPCSITRPRPRFPTGGTGG